MAPRYDTDLNLADHAALIRREANAWVRSQRSSGTFLPIDADDAYQEVWLGLLVRAPEYDPSMGSQSTFVSFYCKKILADLVRSFFGRASAAQKGKLSKRAILGAVSMDAPVGESDSLTLCDVIACPPCEVDAPVDVAQLDRIEDRLELLNPRWAEAFRLRRQGYTMAKIGARLGVTESRACQIFDKIGAVARRYAA